MANPPPQIAILGAGIFVRTQCIPRLAEIYNLLILKSIWSRSEESARTAVEIASKYFPLVECKWGDKGFEEISGDKSIVGVAVILAGQAQGGFILDMGVHFVAALRTILWRVVCLNGTLQVERGNIDGKHRYLETGFFLLSHGYYRQLSVSEINSDGVE